MIRGDPTAIGKGWIIKDHRKFKRLRLQHKENERH